MTNHNEPKKSSGKRKMKEVGETSQINLFNLQPPHFATPASGNTSHVQRVLNAAAPFRSLLAFTSEDGPSDIKHQGEELGKMIKSHGENLTQVMAAMMEQNQHSVNHATDERFAKKLKETDEEIATRMSVNEELEKEVEHYKSKTRKLHLRAMYLERKAASLKEDLRVALSTSQRAEENEQADAESSFVVEEEEKGSVMPVDLHCKACTKQEATVLMWPCRHVCLCARCDIAAVCCPVCMSRKVKSIKVYLPLD